MILNVPIIFKTLYSLKKDYPWEKPQSCSCCQSNRVWGHGYVPAYFDGYKHAFYLKRYRCPECGCVIKMRPKGYFKRFQASIKTIRSSIESKEKNSHWLRDISRSRQQHWYRALLRNIRAHLTDTWKSGLQKAFERLVELKVIPVSRSI